MGELHHSQPCPSLSSRVQRVAADRVLMAFREHPDAWTRVDTILESSSNPQTKYIALQVLENLIKYRWRTLPAEQREGIRTYLVQKVIALSQDERTLRSESVLVSKLNLLLVQVLKHEWPGHWPSFIPDLVGSSKCVAPRVRRHAANMPLGAAVRASRRVTTPSWPASASCAGRPRCCARTT